MLRIVLFSHTFLPQIGGRELVVYQLGRALVDLGHKVRVFGPAGWRTAAGIDFGFPVHRYPVLIRTGFGRRGFLGGLREAEATIKFAFDRLRSGCDIVHAHTTYPAGFIAGLTRRRSAAWGLVITPHGVDIQTIPELGHGMRLRPALREKIARSISEADLLTAISTSIRAALVDAGADAERIRDIPNGVDCERFANPANVCPPGLNDVPMTAPLIVTVGNYHPRKGHEFLIRAMPTVLRRFPDARLVIVGRGTEGLAAEAEALGVNDQVILTGPVAFPLDALSGSASDLLAGLLGRSAVYVSAGTEEQSEGLSLAVLEAMAAGLPVVATDISGNRDVIATDYNGRLVRPGDPAALAEGIVSILSDESSRSAMGRKARECAGNYDWDSIARRYVEVYEETLARRAA